MAVVNDINAWLRRLDRLVDPADQVRRTQLHLAALRGEPVERLPLAINVPVAGEWPRIPLRMAYDDAGLMLLRELGPVYSSCQIGDDRLFMVRANYGVGIVASMFGLAPLFTDDDTLPWFPPLDSRDAIQELVNRGLPPVPSGLARRALETEQFFRQALSRFDNLAQAVSLYHCDLQGPFDIAHLIWGKDIFLAIYDCPGMVHDLLDLITRTYLELVALDKASVGEGKGTCRHWGLLFRGGVVIREDSATLLSPAAYKEFSLPYTARILDAWGGAIHLCGRGGHLFGLMGDIPGLTGFHLGNPEKYDLLDWYRAVRARGLNAVGWGSPLAPAHREECRTGITLNPVAPDVAAARALTQEHIGRS